MITRFALCLVLISVISGCTSSSSNSRFKASEADLKSASVTNVQLAIGYIKREQYDVAKGKLDKAIEQDHENIEAYKMMAYLMGILNKPEDAESYYVEALGLDEDDPEIHNSYGTFLCQHDRGEEAQEEFKLAYDNPYYKTKYLAYSNAGTCLIKLKKYKAAENFLRRALQEQPKLADALVSMAEVGIKSGKYLMSRAYIQRFHADNKPTPYSLWLQMKAEKALGARDHYIKVAKRLLELFPDSVQAGDVEESVRYERTR